MKISSLYKKHMQSVKSKLIFNVIIIHALLMSLVVFDLTQREKSFMLEQLSQKGHELTSILASTAAVSLLNNDLVALDELILDMNQIKDHNMIFILDKHGRVRASTKKEYFNTYLDDNVSKEMYAKLSDGNLKSYQSIHNNLVDTLYAIKIKNRLIGYTRTLIDKTYLSREIDIITNKGLLYIVLAIILGAFFAWMAVRKMTDRLNRVAQAAEQISKKHFDVNLPVSDSQDEVSKMINAFNVMSRSLQEYIGELNTNREKLQLSEQILLEAQEIAHIGNWELDLKTSLMQWSPEVYRIRGKDIRTYRPTLQDHYEALSEDDKIATQAALKNLIATGEKTELDSKIYLDDGSVKYIHITGIVHYDESGDACKITGTTQDITNHKESEIKLKQRENQLLVQSRLAQMGELLSMIAHQWRQPLTAISATAINLRLKIILNAFDLQTQNGLEECKSFYLSELEQIEEFVLNLSTTIDDFRNFYKINKKTVKVSIDTVLNKALNIINGSLENNKIEVIYKANSKNKQDLYDGELMQVILNILKNAQDNFKEKNINGGKIHIITNDNMIEIFDNGGGIPEDIINRIFDPYFSSKDEKTGTGLGLYMSKIIIEDHHKGTLRVKNIYDNDGLAVGACFSISL